MRLLAASKLWALRHLHLTDCHLESARFGLTTGELALVPGSH